MKRRTAIMNTKEMAGEDEKLQSPEQCDGVLKRAAY